CDDLISPLDAKIQYDCTQGQPCVSRGMSFCTAKSPCRRGVTDGSVAHAGDDVLTAAGTAVHAPCTGTVRTGTEDCTKDKFDGGKTCDHIPSQDTWSDTTGPTWEAGYGNYLIVDCDRKPDGTVGGSVLIGHLLPPGAVPDEPDVVSGHVDQGNIIAHS